MEKTAGAGDGRGQPFELDISWSEAPPFLGVMKATIRARAGHDDTSPPANRGEGERAGGADTVSARSIQTAGLYVKSG